VVERIGQVAYRLQLPDNARIHDVFHVGVLKPFIGTPPGAPYFCLNAFCAPGCSAAPSTSLLLPERVLRSRLQRGSWHILVQWAGLPPAEATWESVDSFRVAHPSFQLEDELFPEEGSDVMVGKTYHRRQRG
jgi:hypothetical protein